jgi:hypothetical protein
MPRKKSKQTEPTQVPTDLIDANSTTAVAEPPPRSPMFTEEMPEPPVTGERFEGQAKERPTIARPEWIDGPTVALIGADHDGTPEVPKNWGPPYKSIFTCPEQGFELGENRRFKQRVFMFTERPSQEILAVLKENGFKYRDSEKAWTITADAVTRKMTDEMARDWAGPNYIRSIER